MRRVLGLSRRLTRVRGILRRGYVRVPRTRGVLRVGKIKRGVLTKVLTRVKSVEEFSSMGRVRGLDKVKLMTYDSNGRGKRAGVDREKHGELQC